MYGNEELFLLRNLKGKVYTLPSEYEMSELAQAVLEGSKRVEIWPVQRVSLDDRKIHPLERGYWIDVGGSRSCYWDSISEIIFPEGVVRDMNRQQYLAVLLGKTLGETDPLIQYLLGEFLLMTHTVIVQDEKIVVDGQFRVGEILTFPVKHWQTLDIFPKSQLALTLGIVGKTDTIYDQQKLGEARRLASRAEDVMIGLVCVETGKGYAEFRVLGDDDGLIVLFNAKFDLSKRVNDLNLGPGEYTLMGWSITAPMGRLKYAKMYCIDRGAREEYAKQIRG